MKLEVEQNAITAMLPMIGWNVAGKKESIREQAQALISITRMLKQRKINTIDIHSVKFCQLPILRSRTDPNNFSDYPRI